MTERDANPGRPCPAVTSALPDPPRPPTAVAPDGGYLPDDDIDYEVLRRAFFLLLFGDAIRRLAEQQEEIIDLMVWGRLKLTEVAARLDLPRTTVMDRYKKALAELRRLARNDPTVEQIFSVLRDLF